ncbi:hypothetical protein [uncultured Lacinutrix sp.]|uniref:hypothetical protein n=1 Tax=uncultured Lacinutrix sp. TaxID=574032 RepID=UPI002635FBF9|nr:hypothetical protein [uncultured Lacinutrix sp.]
MNNGLILIITFTIPVVILLLFYVLIKNRKKRHLVSLDLDWSKFEKAIEYKDINGVNKYGTELIWNENLTDAMLKKMIDYVEELAVDNLELKNLQNLIFNKNLHWNRNYRITRY